MDRLKEFALDVLALIIAIILGGVSFFILGVIAYGIIMYIPSAFASGVIWLYIGFTLGLIVIVVLMMLGLSWATDFVDERYYKWKRKRKKADK